MCYCKAYRQSICSCPEGRDTKCIIDCTMFRVIPGQALKSFDKEAEKGDNAEEDTQWGPL